MSDLPACLLIVTARIEPAYETQWNKWYDDVHLPAALACPGVLRGSRYVSERGAALTNRGEKTTDEAKTYTTVYELSSPEALDTPEFEAMRGWYEFSDHIEARTQVVTRL